MICDTNQRRHSSGSDVRARKTLHLHTFSICFSDLRTLRPLFKLLQLSFKLKKIRQGLNKKTSVGLSDISLSMDNRRPKILLFRL